MAWFDMDDYIVVVDDVYQYELHHQIYRPSLMTRILGEKLIPQLSLADPNNQSVIGCSVRSHHLNCRKEDYEQDLFSIAKHEIHLSLHLTKLLKTPI